MLSPLDRTPSPHDHMWRPPSATEMLQSTIEILGNTIREDLPEEAFMQHEEDLSIDCDIFNVHFQLRKTVVCVGNTTYFTTVDGVHSYNYLTHKLERPITSLAATQQYLVVGGAVGSLLVYDLLSSSIIWDSLVKGNTLNAFAFHYIFKKSPSTGEKNRVAVPEIRLVCANNNPRHGVQIFSLPSMQYVARLICPTIQDRTPIGGVQVSPNQKWILAVGDNLQVFLIRYNKEQEENEDKSQLYTIVNRIQVPGMCFDCSWAPTSTMFAVSCEAGYVILFNLKGEVIHSYPAFGLGSAGLFHRIQHSIASPYKRISIVSYDPSDPVNHTPCRQDITISHLALGKGFESIVGIDWTSTGTLAVGVQRCDPKERFSTPKPLKMILAEKTGPQGRLLIFNDVQEKSLKQLCIRFVQQNIHYFLQHQLEELQYLPLDLQECTVGDLDELQQEIASDFAVSANTPELS